jgi:hypothetical protein
LAACGVGGVLMSLSVRMGWGFGGISGGIEGYFQVMLGLRWEMVLMLNIGMICGVGTMP